jgi:hypothetical protein
MSRYLRVANCAASYGGLHVQFYWEPPDFASNVKLTSSVEK